MLRVFKTSGPARFAFRAVFGDKRYANLSFFDAALEDIPFHMSLRVDDGIVAMNNRWSSEWGQERHVKVPIAESGTDVEVVFDNGHLSVRIGGEEIPDLDGPEAPFQQLDQIAMVEYRGVTPMRAMDLDTRPDGDSLGSPLSVSRQLELRGCLPAGTPPVQLHISGLDAPVPVPLAEPEAGHHRYTVVIPGRVWDGGAEAVEIALRGPDGADLAQARLSRDAMLRHVRDILAVRTLSGDSYLATVLAEHLKYSGLLGDLNADELRVFSQAMRALKLTDYFGALPAPVDTGPVQPRLDQTRVHAAIAQVAAAQSDPEAIRAALADLRLGVTEGRQVFIALMEPLCATDNTRALTEWADIAALGPFEPGPDDWYNSAILPWLYVKGRMTEVAQVLEALVEPRSSWLVTPAIAWVVRQAAANPRLGRALREWMVHSFSRFLVTHAPDYWERTPCAALIRAAVDLVALQDQMPAPLAAAVEQGVLRTYGLSRDFWRAMDRNGARLPDLLRTGRAAFAAVEDAALGGDSAAEAHRALSWLQINGTLAVQQVRRDVFGPAGVPGARDALPEPEALMMSIPDAQECATRAAAFPDDNGPSGTLAAYIARAMERFYDQVSPEPKADVQSRAVARAMAIADGTEAADGLEPLAADLMALMVPDTQYSGLSIALSLLASVAGGDSEDAVFAMAQRLVLSVAEEEREALASSPAVRAAFSTLGHRGGTAPQMAALLPDLQAWPVPETPALAGNPMFDTLVTVFSCRAHLDSRIPAMRAGWLGQLRALGIPYVIIVGDGDGTLEGDILAVDAPDDYEGLPQKTLATIEWVHDHTQCMHMVKVDDDCFVNVDGFFGSWSYRKADYFGRPLTRDIGQTDRAWHIAKSSTTRGRTELDKSPEPSTYADGGSGYALSRRAMGAALRAARGAAGQVLQQVSFMEDKLLGDLLTLEGIAVENTGYHVAIRRRMAPGGRPVSRWVNGFDASRAAPVKLVHMDAADGQEGAVAQLSATSLTPKKVWPSFQDLRLGYQTNTLELISPQARLDRARGAKVAVVAAMRNEMFMLPHFLRHYRRLGVDSFLIADNGSDDGTLEYLAEQDDVALFSVDTDYNLSRYGVAWQQALMANFRVNQWSLVADADELLVWQSPQSDTLPALLARPEFAESDAARVFMLDMYPAGQLAEADFAGGDPFAVSGYVDRDPFLTTWPGRGPYSNARTWTSALRHRLIPGTRPDLFVAQKLALLRYRPWMRFSDGLHYGAGMQVAARELLFGHFKYNADFHRKVQDEVARGQHFNDAEEYRKYQSRLSEGRDVIFDADVSVRWDDSAFVRARLDRAD